MLAILTLIVIVAWCFLGNLIDKPGLFLETTCQRTDANASAASLKLATSLQQEALQLLDHLKSKYPSDARTKTLDQVWNKQVLPATMFDNPRVKASFNKKTGCLYMRLDEVRSLDAWRAVLLHELAHVSGKQHDETYRQMWLFLLKVATKELGWTVKLNCQTACTSYNVCGTDCELCDCV